MGSFNNMGISSLWIDGKPVKRASLGGKVFYAKHDYNLSLTSDKDILSFKDNDVATLTATLTDDGEPVSGETCFICDSNVELKKGYGNYSQDVIFLTCDGDGTITLATNCDFVVKDSDGNTLYYGHISAGTTTWTLSGTTLTASDWAPRTTELPSNGFILEVYVNNDINNIISNDSYNHFYYLGTTDSNGECSVSYDSKGTGDLNIKVECMNLRETYSVEDCIYYNGNEKSITQRYSQSLYDSNLSVALPTNVEISFEAHVPSPLDYDYRYLLFSKSEFTGTTNYPHNYISIDKRQNYVNWQIYENDSYSITGTSSTAKNNNYALIKYVKTGTKITAYVDGTLMYTITLSWIDNYQDYTLSMMKWSGSKTMYMKNVKIKPL